jgi:ATPase
LILSLREAATLIYVPDISSLLEGITSRLVKEGKIKGRIIIHKAALSVFEREAINGRATGSAGLKEVRRLRQYAEEGMVEVEIGGEKPRTYENLDENTANAIIRDYAYELGATLVTGDKTQAIIAETLGIPVIYVPPREAGLIIDSFFDELTMSVHLKEGVPPIAKKGRPGDWVYTKISSEPLSHEELENIANEIVREAKRRPDGFIEIDRFGSTIVQLGTFRIIITRPPLSDGWEITAVKPVRKLRLEDYNLPAKLVKRLNERAEGILIAGAPGMGKTTFAQALAEYYMNLGKVVKTVEAPRDMNLPPAITQYSKNYADLDEIHDILLLSRPDYTVFDEMRSDEDFKLYADLRLAGIGMIGVVHATSPIDAIQRFIGRVELGVIPSLIDTVIFIKNGYVEKVYEVKMTVKLPTGLREAELSRPVIEVRDFITGELEYEIYTFGEQTVVIPVRKYKENIALGMVDRIAKRVSALLPGADVKVEDGSIIVILPRNLIKAYNKKIRRLRKLEEKYNIPIRIRIAG